MQRVEIRDASPRRFRTLDELASAAWSYQRLPLAGWDLRMADGFTLRANSVLPTRFTGGNLGRTIAQVEDIFAAHNLAPAFQLVPTYEPGGLPKALQRRGYDLGTPCEMWVANIHEILTPRAARDHAIVTPKDVSLHRVPGDAWLPSWFQMTARGRADLPAAASILGAMPPMTRFASALNGTNRLIGTGVGVVEDATLGLFCIATTPMLRRLGIAEAVIRELAGWGGRAGASVAYLQVAASNTGAKALYAGLGFRHAYDYAYAIRRLP